MYATIGLQFSKAVDIKELMSTVYGGSGEVGDDQRKKILGSTRYIQHRNEGAYLEAVSFAKKTADYIFIVINQSGDTASTRNFEIWVENVNLKDAVRELKKSTHSLLRQLLRDTPRSGVKVEYEIRIVSESGPICSGKKEGKDKRIVEELRKGTGVNFLAVSIAYGYSSNFGLDPDKIKVALVTAGLAFVISASYELYRSRNEVYVYEDD